MEHDIAKIISIHQFVRKCFLLIKVIRSVRFDPSPTKSPLSCRISERVFFSPFPTKLHKVANYNQAQVSTGVDAQIALIKAGILQIGLDGVCAHWKVRARASIKTLLVVNISVIMARDGRNATAVG